MVVSSDLRKSYFITICITLENYFTFVVSEDLTHSYDRINKALQSKFGRLHTWSSSVSGRFNSFNILFQSEGPLLQCLRKELEGLIRPIASDFMFMEYVKRTVLTQIDGGCSRFHVLLKQVYIGMAATATLREIEAARVGQTRHQELEKFYRTAGTSFIESIEQIQKRFDMDAEILTIVQCI